MTNKCEKCGGDAAGGLNLATCSNAPPNAPAHWVCFECVAGSLRFVDGCDADRPADAAPTRCDWPRCEEKSDQPFTGGVLLTALGFRSCRTTVGCARSTARCSIRSTKTRRCLCGMTKRKRKMRDNSHLPADERLEMLIGFVADQLPTVDDIKLKLRANASINTRSQHDLILEMVGSFAANLTNIRKEVQSIREQREEV